MGNVKPLWSPKRPPPKIKGKALNPNAAIEDRYYRALKDLINEMTEQTERDLIALFRDAPAQRYFAQDASIVSQAKKIMNMITVKFDDLFDKNAKPISDKMAAAESVSSAASLHASLKILSGGLELKTGVISGTIKEVLNATVAENVSLIKSISSEYLTQVQGAVMRSITTGRGLQDLVPFLNKQKGITIRRARIISGDQTRKAFANLNAARMEKIGIKKYEWLHSSGSQHPRKLHQQMSGKIYSFDKPPVIDLKTGQRGKPGDLINCHCRMIPVVTFEE